MIRNAVILLLTALVLNVGSAAFSQDAGGQAPSASSGKQAVPVHLFWTRACPHCAKAKAFLEGLAKRDPQIAVRARDVEANEVNQRAYIAVGEHFRINSLVVPIIVIGERPFVGYEGDATTGMQIDSHIEACKAHGCNDVAGTIIGRAMLSRSQDFLPESQPSVGHALPKKVNLPFLGNIDVEALSLPALTIVLAAVDGFNPCAMWVLIFLIGLLLGMQDSFRMWSYGAAFLITSALVYFAFLAAWLNLFLLLGSLAWIRVAIGLFAFGAGGYYLWQFVNNPDAACPVTSGEERQSTMARLRDAVSERSYLLAISGIVVLAVAVNLIELLCSAGIPAIYTQVLALSDLPPVSYYGYLTLYITIFLLDDAIVFITAMVTLRAAGLAASYARYSHLIGGVVLGAIGILLLFRPSWLTFT